MVYNIRFLDHMLNVFPFIVNSISLSSFSAFSQNRILLHTLFILINLSHKYKLFFAILQIIKKTAATKGNRRKEESIIALGEKPW